MTARTDFVDDQSEVLGDAIAAVECAGEYLGRACDAARARFPGLAERVRTERASLDAIRTQLSRVRNGRDAGPTGPVKGPKQQVPAIRDARDRVKEMAGETETPAEVGGYLEMCVDCLGQAETFVSELP